jgi:hypothetical protein
MLSPETLSRVSYLQQKVINGTATMEDMREGVKLLREDRLHVAQSAARAKKAPVNVGQLFDDLDKL